MKKRIIYISGIVLLSILFILAVIVFSPILKIAKADVQISSDESITAIGQDLKSHNIIPSVFIFKTWMRLTRNDKKIIPGDYLFDQYSSIYITSKRLATADYRTDQSKIIIPEGSTVSDIGLILQKTYPNLDVQSFVKDATSDEGYLFPDTYNLFSSTSNEDIINSLKQNFDIKTADLHTEATSEGKDWSNIVIMASILEEEGKTAVDRKIIAGILYKRLEVGVALQVDSDLSTYSNPGLPPAPITNPGLESIDAAINPTPTDYFYFLTGNDGKMYYAKTFAEHVANKKKYLN